MGRSRDKSRIRHATPSIQLGLKHVEWVTNVYIVSRLHMTHKLCAAAGARTYCAPIVHARTHRVQATAIAGHVRHPGRFLVRVCTRTHTRRTD